MIYTISCPLGGRWQKINHGARRDRLCLRVLPRVARKLFTVDLMVGSQVKVSVIVFCENTARLIRHFIK